MIQVAETGRTPTMRYMSRTHRVDVAWLQEVSTTGDVLIQYAPTDTMAADIYTKRFTDSLKWEHARQLINVLSPQEQTDRQLIATLIGASPEEGCPSGGPQAAGGMTSGGPAAYVEN